MNVVLAKLALSSLLGVCILIILHPNIRKKFTSRNSFIFTYIISRIIPFVVLYIGLDYDGGSDLSFFYSYASDVLAGKLMYRDFWQPYSPLFSYVNAAALLLWNSPKAIIIVMMVGEVIALWLTKKLHLQSNYLYFNCYLLLPMSFVNNIIANQEDVLLWLFYAAFLLFFVNNKIFKSAIIYMLGIITTKVLFVFPLFVIPFRKKNQKKSLTLFALTGVVTLGCLLLIFGKDITAPLQLGELPFAPNMISVLNPFFDFNNSQLGLLNFVLIGMVLAGAVYIFYRLPKVQNKPGEILLYTTGFVVFYILLIVVHKNSLPNYWYIVSMPIAVFYLEFLSRSQLISFLLLNVIAAIYPSLWYNTGADWANNFLYLDVIFMAKYCIELLYLTLSLNVLFSIFQISRNKLVDHVDASNKGSQFI